MWLPQASAEELRDFWRRLVEGGSDDDTLKNLLMNRWVELAPDEAIAETLNTPDEHLPWMAWGRVNPELAAREAKARKSGQFWRVLQGAATIHPDVVIKLLEESPGYAYPAVTDAIREGFQNDGWQAALEYQYNPRTLASWSRDEPERAFEWALANASKMMDSSEGPWKNVVPQILEADPGKLDAAIASLAQGKLKSDLVAAKAKALATADPEAALAMADAAEKGAPRDRLIAIIGPTLLETDPVKSVLLLRELVSKGLMEQTTVRPNGSSGQMKSWVSGSYDSWINPLLEKDANAVLDGLSPQVANPLTDQWRSHDPEGYGEWVLDLPEGETRNHHCAEMAKNRSQQVRSGTGSTETISLAMEWTARISDAALRDGTTRSLIHHWMTTDRAATESYFGENGSAGAAEKAVFETYRNQQPQ